jgi:two-component system, NtrC family, sensor kinase
MGKLTQELQPASPFPFEKHSRELLSILSTNNPSTGVQQLQTRLLGYMLNLTNANGVMVFTIQATAPHIAERFLFSPNEEIKLLESVPIEGIDLQSYQASITGQHIDLRKDAQFRSAMYILAPGLQAQSVYFSPLVVNQENFGFLLILDPVILQDSHVSSLMAMAATNLANATLNHRLMQQFQITIADLEASRWEVLNSRNTLRTLFDNMPMSIYIVNKDYSIAALNRHRAAQLDISITSIVGRKCYKVLFNRDSICPGCEINQSLLEGKNTARLHQVWREGQEQPTILDIASYPVLSEEKNIVQAIMVEDDITEKRRLEDSLIQNEKMAAVGQLAAGMAHEINNPLAAIIANAQLITREAKDNADIVESADLIEQAGVRASQTIRDLLRFSRQESYTFTQTDLNESIEKVVSLLQFQLVKKNAKIKLDLETDIPIINASEDHLQSVWVNLIVNALDAGGEEPLEITVTTRYANGEFITLVADNGQGIPQDKLSKIFTPFYTTKSPGSGTGLGLSICHRIVTNHGGEIRVESRIGHGTRFIVILPEKYP